jgi:hypothetical protein
MRFEVADRMMEVTAAAVALRLNERQLTPNHRSKPAIPISTSSSR